VKIDIVPAPQQKSEDLPSLVGVRVLVVDDSPSVLEILAAVLQQNGATVTATCTAKEALRLLEDVRPHVLLSDLEMPEKDGYWLLREVRALPPERGGSTPAACLTGRIEAEDRARVLRVGFQYHIPKPVETRKMLGIVALLALKA
jgi:CheY-like chemotaxis protein